MNFEQKLNRAWQHVECNKTIYHVLRDNRLARQNVFFKRLTFVLIFAFISIDAYSATCQELFFTGVQSSNGREYNAYYTDLGEADVSCSEHIVLTQAEYVQFKVMEEFMQGINEITAFQIGEAFTWGFGTYVFFWFMGYCIKNARKTIRHA